MDELRVVLALVIFSISSYLVYDLFVNGFDWVVLVFCILGYVAVHYIWPKHQPEESAWYDALELIVDLPYRAMALCIRSIGRVVGKSDAGVDIDF